MQTHPVRWGQTEVEPTVTARLIPTPPSSFSPFTLYFPFLFISISSLSFFPNFFPSLHLYLSYSSPSLFPLYSPSPSSLYLPFLLISPSLLFHRLLYTLCLTIPFYPSFLFSLHISLTSVYLCATENCSMIKIIHPSLN